MPMPRVLLLAVLLLASPLHAQDEEASPSLWATWLAPHRQAAADPAPHDNGLTFALETPRRPVPLAELSLEQMEEIRVLGHDNLPLKVMMVLVPRTMDEVQQMLDILREIHASAPADRSEKLKLHLIIDSEETLRRLRLERSEVGDLVEINRYQGADPDDLWLQDWGEVAMVKAAGQTEPKLMVLDTNRGRESLAELPAVLARQWSGFFYRKPTPSPRAGDFGGNIEVTPDDLLMLGSTTSPELRALFDGRGYRDRTVVLDTEWLRVGHVDEYLTTLPSPTAARGYRVAVADPRLGLEILGRIRTEDFDAQMQGFVEALARGHRQFPRGVAEDEDELSRLAFENLYGLHAKLAGISLEDRRDQFETPLEVMVDDADSLVASNEEASRRIESNLERLIAAIRTASGDDATPVEVVRVPALFESFSKKTTYALVPASINMVVLREHVVVPDPLIPAFRDEIQRRLGEAEVVPHFVSDASYHHYDGQLHCGTNVFRHPNRYLYRSGRATERSRRFQEMN